jgi:uncharacterized protein
MAEIGKWNRLIISKAVDFGVYVDADELGEILLPQRYVPEVADVGDEVEVFIYHDSQDRLIATTQKPKASLGECAYVEVVGVATFGAFADWGLSKDLFIPLSQQRDRMREGYKYLIKVIQDPLTHRLMGTALLNDHLSETADTFEPNDEVTIQIAYQTDLGYKVIVNHQYWAVLHLSDVFRPIEKGDMLKGFIKQVRPDGKLDVCLQKAGTAYQVDELGEHILHHVAHQGGILYLTDKSAPEEIYRTFKTSKGRYKKALGALYKQRKIELTDKFVRLIEDSADKE